MTLKSLAQNQKENLFLAQKIDFEFFEKKESFLFFFDEKNFLIPAFFDSQMPEWIPFLQEKKILSHEDIEKSVSFIFQKFQDKNSFFFLWQYKENFPFIKENSSFSYQKSHSEYQYLFLKENFLQKEKKIQLLGNFRLAEEKDLTRLVDIYTLSYNDDPQTSFLNLQKSIQRNLAETHVKLFVLEYEGKIVSSFYVKTNSKDIYLYGIATHPDSRKKGFAKIGMQYLLEKEFFAYKDTHHIWLEVDTSNIAASQLYLSCGFVELSKIDYYLFTKVPLNS